MRTCISALTEQTSHFSLFFFFFSADSDDEDYVEPGEFVTLLCVVSYFIHMHYTDSCTEPGI